MSKVPTIITTTATPPARDAAGLPTSPQTDDPLNRRMSNEVGLETMMEEAPPEVSSNVTRWCFCSAKS